MILTKDPHLTQTKQNTLKVDEQLNVYLLFVVWFIQIVLRDYKITPLSKLY